MTPDSAIMPNIGCKISIPWFPLTFIDDAAANGLNLSRLAGYYMLAVVASQ